MALVHLELTGYSETTQCTGINQFKFAPRIHTKSDKSYDYVSTCSKTIFVQKKQRNEDQPVAKTEKVIHLNKIATQ